MNERKDYEGKRRIPRAGSRTDVNFNCLTTVEHDGHFWVVGVFNNTYGSGAHFVHHPDCPCKEGK